MPSTFSPLKIQLMATGENNTTWGDVTNLNLGTALEEAIVGSADVTFASADVTLTLTDTNASQTARNMRLRCTGTTGGATRNLVVPSIEKPYIVRNDCADSVVVKTAAGTGITVPAGKTMWVYSDATNVVDAVTHLSSLTLGTDLAVSDGGTGASTFTANGVIYGNTTSALLATAAGTTGQVLVGNTGGAPSWATLTGIGVTSFSAGTTGLTPSTATTGVVTLAGTLGVANGGTGTATAFTAGSVVFAGASGVYSQDNANLFWDNTNDRLGIGTATPGDKLSIVDQNNAGFRFNEYNDVEGSVLRLSSARGTIASPTALTTGGTIFGVRGFGYSSAGTFGAAVASINARAAENFTATAQGSYLEFLNTATGTTTLLERMRIAANGNVGIGTVTPVAKLDVNGDAAFGSTIITGSGVSTGDVRIELGGYRTDAGNTYMDFHSLASQDYNSRIVRYGGTNSAMEIINAGTGSMAFATDNVTRMSISGTGNVGIGVTNPTAPLTVKSRSADNISYRVLASSNGTGTIQFTDDPVTTGWASIAATSSSINIIGGTGVVTLSTAAQERMRVNSGGDVGIGTTAPAGKLHVVTGTNNSLLFRGPVNLATGGSIYAVNEANSILTPMELAASTFLLTGGNVGIGVASPAYQLQIQGLGQDTAALTDAGNKGGSLYLRANGITSGSGGALLFGTTFGNQTPFAAIKGLVTDGGTNTTGDLAFSTRNSIADTALTERMRIALNGNVGIGTSAPGSRLEVLGGTVGTTAGNETLIANQRALAGGNSVQLLTRLIRRSNGTDWTTTAMRLQGRVDVSDYGYIDFVAGGGANMAFGIGSTQHMIMDSSGNLGIGNSTTSDRINVGGNVQLSNATYGYYGAISGAVNTQFAANGSGASLDIRVISNHPMTFFTNNAERMRVAATGDVGIGTSAPSVKLDVIGNVLAREDNAGGANPVLLRNSNAGNNTTKGSSALFQGTDTVGTVKNIGSIGFFPDDADYIGSNLRFLVRSGDATPTERARITSSGNLLVGTTTLGAVGTVNGVRARSDGRAIISSATDGVLEVGYNGANATGTVVSFYKGGALGGSITTDGSTTAYNTSSDYRLKDIDGPIANSGAYIDALKPVQGSWKADGSRFIGLLAHEVQEVSETTIATGEKNGEKMQAMDYSAPELIANLIAEIQSLRARVAQLEGN